MMRKYRLLDLFCGAGGSGEGYVRSGFMVHGIDIASQKHYPYTFTRCDALEYLEANGHLYDVIHASPPCPRYSKITPKSHKEKHPDLIKPVQEILHRLGKPYVIENVESARHLLVNPIMLCGSMFGLRVRRHRYFETSFPLWFAPATCNHSERAIYLTGSPRFPDGSRTEPNVMERRSATGIQWMTQDELDDSIPPAYTEWIGKQLIRHLEQSEATTELAV